MAKTFLSRNDFELMAQTFNDKKEFEGVKRDH